MGRIKTQLVKRVTFELYAKHKEKFNKEFSDNKLVVRRLSDMSSKKLINTVSGYVTRMVKEGKEI